MSIQAVAWVLDRSESAGSVRLVMIAIANHVGPTGWAWPSVPAIARESKVDERTVYRCMKVLEELGELTVERRPGKPSRYGLTALIINVSPLTTCHPPDDVSPLTQVSLTPDTGVTRTIKNQKNLTRARTREALPPPLDSDTRAKGAEYFKELRKAR